MRVFLAPLARLSLLIFILLPGSAMAVWEAPGPAWQEKTQGALVFHFLEPGRKNAEFLAEQGEEALRRISETTGLPIPTRMDVVLAPDQRSFVKLQPSPPPSWAAGTAWSDRATLYLRLDLPRHGVNPLPQVYVHELTHLVVGQSFGDRSPPRWLSEGLARLLAGELDPEDHMLLVRAALTGTLLPLSELTRSWPRHAGRAHLAYAQSVHFTIFLNRRGDDVLPRLLSRLAAGQPVELALQDATGLGLEALEKAWRGRMTWGHIYLPVLGGSGAVWGFASVLFLVASFKRRRSFRAQLKRMADREARERLFEAPASGPSGSTNDASIRPSSTSSKSFEARDEHA